MAIPSQTEMYEIVLLLMEDGRRYSRQMLRDAVEVECGLSKGDMAQTTSSGVPVYRSRADWAVSTLSAAGLIRREAKGIYVITDDGRQALEKGTTHIICSLSKPKVPKLASKDIPAPSVSVPSAELEEPQDDPQDDDFAPQESIEQAVCRLNETLADELVGRVLWQDDAFFERLVVRLLEAMGYGAGRAARQADDGGAGGFISTDELGFNPIYVQIRRYTDEVVDSPEIQAFAGALNGVPNGVFITTSTFSKSAIAFAQGCKTARIALIDGHRLGELMIRYNVGVQTSSMIEIKKIDADFFGA